MNKLPFVTTFSPALSPESTCTTLPLANPNLTWRSPIALSSPATHTRAVLPS